MRMVDTVVRDRKFAIRGLVHNPLFTIVAIGLTAVAALASYLPARRVAAVDPAGALGAE